MNEKESIQGGTNKPYVSDIAFQATYKENWRILNKESQNPTSLLSLMIMPKHSSDPELT